MSTCVLAPILALNGWGAWSNEPFSRQLVTTEASAANFLVIITSLTRNPLAKLHRMFGCPHSRKMIDHPQQCWSKLAMFLMLTWAREEESNGDWQLAYQY